MKKQMEESAATGAAAGRGCGDVFGPAHARDGAASPARRGSRVRGAGAGGHGARASQWRDQLLVAGQAGLKSRTTEAVDEDSRRLQAKVGELLMENEWLYATVDHLEAGGPLARRRSTR